jgi:hypothetical protein
VVTPSEGSQEKADSSDESYTLEDVLARGAKDPSTQGRDLAQDPRFRPTSFQQASSLADDSEDVPSRVRVVNPMINPFRTPYVPKSSVYMQPSEGKEELNAAQFQNMNSRIDGLISGLQMHFEGQIKYLNDELNANRALILDSNVQTVSMVQQLRDVVVASMKQSRDQVPSQESSSQEFATPGPTIHFADETVIDDGLMNQTMKSISSTHEKDVKHDHNSRAKYVGMYIDEVAKHIAATPLLPIVSGPNALDSLLKLEKTMKFIIAAWTAANLMAIMLG